MIALFRKYYSGKTHSGVLNEPRELICGGFLNLYVGVRCDKQGHTTSAFKWSVPCPVYRAMEEKNKIKFPSLKLMLSFLETCHFIDGKKKKNMLSCIPFPLAGVGVQIMSSSIHR